MFRCLGAAFIVLLTAATYSYAQFGQSMMMNGKAVVVIPSLPLSPPPLTPPPGAVNAGFTTLAANYDFTQTLPTNWLDCGAGDGAAHQWYQGGVFGGTPVTCNVFQTNDGGSLVLDMQWLPSMANTTQDGGILIIGTLSKDHNHVTDFPNNAYFEFEARVVPSQPTNPTNFPIMAGWMYNSTVANVHGGVNNSNWEVDIVETYGANTGSYDANFPSRGYLWQGTSSLPGGYDAAQYHKYAVRLTSDGSAVRGCAYVDNVLINAGCAGGVGGADVIGLRSFLIMWLGQGNVPANNAIPQMDLFIRGYRVWSCPGWATANCNGALLPSP